jgi:hypothetical protein
MPEEFPARSRAPRGGPQPDRQCPAIAETREVAGRDHPSAERRRSRAPVSESGGVTLVCAPAGSDKTVLLRAWVDHANLDDHTGWVYQQANPEETGPPGRVAASLAYDAKHRSCLHTWPGGCAMKSLRRGNA